MGAGIASHNQNITECRAYRTPGMEAGRVKGEGRGRAPPLEKRGYGWDYSVGSDCTPEYYAHTWCGKIYTRAKVNVYK